MALGKIVVQRLREFDRNLYGLEAWFGAKDFVVWLALNTGLVNRFMNTRPGAGRTGIGRTQRSRSEADPCDNF